MTSQLALGDEIFRVAFDRSPSGVLVVDAAGTIVLVNREVERLFGYSREELIGESIDLLFPGRHGYRLPASPAEFRAGLSSRPMGEARELHGLRRDGTLFPVEVDLNPVETTQGRVTLASVVDITLRRQSERLLREYQERTRELSQIERLGTLAVGIAHDCNCMFAAIVGRALLGQRRGSLTPAHYEDLEMILRSTDRGRQLVQTILTLSRSRPVDLKKMVSEGMSLLRASLPGTIEMREHTDPDIPPVMSDESQIHQVLMYLATDSYFAMDSGGVLDVRLDPFLVDNEFAHSHPPLRPGLHARMSVIDSGMGLPPNVIARGFEPFLMTRASSRGTGLGMSVIHSIVASHAGAIEVTRRVGEGTRVDVYLPGQPPMI